jgi:hypothetical protein
MDSDDRSISVASTALELFLPTYACRFFRDFRSFYGGHFLSSCGTPFATPGAAAGGSLPCFLWRGRSILDLAAGDINHQLGKLGWVTRTFAKALLWHDASMRDKPSRFQRLEPALFKGAHSPQLRSFPGRIVSLYTNCRLWISPDRRGRLSIDFRRAA